jgi:hypothetical protein
MNLSVHSFLSDAATQKSIADDAAIYRMVRPNLDIWAEAAKYCLCRLSHYSMAAHQLSHAACVATAARRASADDIFPDPPHTSQGFWYWLKIGWSAASFSAPSRSMRPEPLHLAQSVYEAIMSTEPAAASDLDWRPQHQPASACLHRSYSPAPAPSPG